MSQPLTSEQEVAEARADLRATLGRMEASITRLARHYPKIYSEAPGMVRLDFRVTPELERRIARFTAAHGGTQAAALRALVERGLENT